MFIFIVCMILRINISCFYQLNLHLCANLICSNEKDFVFWAPLHCMSAKLNTYWAILDWYFPMFLINSFNLYCIAQFLILTNDDELIQRNACLTWSTDLFSPFFVFLPILVVVGGSRLRNQKIFQNMLMRQSYLAHANTLHKLRQACVL